MQQGAKSLCFQRGLIVLKVYIWENLNLERPKYLPPVRLVSLAAPGDGSAKSLVTLGPAAVSSLVQSQALGLLKNRDGQFLRP